jgi:C4-dicarboxylate-specific signal transduction histidine kinase
MTRIAAFVTENVRLAWTVALAVVGVCALLVALAVRDAREHDRLSRLEIEAQRRGIEIASQTLNGNIMGALGLLGTVDDVVKADVLGTAPPNGAKISFLLESVSRAHDAEGVFVVGGDGVVRSSWDSSGRPSSGLDVRFRPYFRMAMQGIENVYAAVSLARGDRALYFTHPVHATGDPKSPPAGVVVARTGVQRVDRLLADAGGIALLLSPQGVVFASSRPEWVGFLDGAPTPERLRAIRELKQFGALFEGREPKVLPVAVTPGLRALDGVRHAVATAPIRWNDPSGDWTLVLMEDLTRTVRAEEAAWAGLAAFGLLMVVGVLALMLLRNHHAQLQAARRIEAYAKAQEASSERKSRQAEAALRLQRAKTLSELGQAFLAEAHRILGALQGMVYVFEDGRAAAMALAASYGCDGRVPASLEPGEGLVGQCVLDRQPRTLATNDHHSWTIRSGLGNACPAAVMIAPLLLDDVALGVVEIAVLNPPDEHAGELFLELASLLALNVQILRRNAPAGAATTEAVP